MRAFTAVDIDDPQVLDKLEEIQSELDYGFNKVDKEKMHLTLQFFQDINSDEVEEIKSALHQMEISSFNLKLKGVGVFPSKEYIRVVWAGAECENIFDLKQQVSQHTVEEDNDHDFHPHVTLARVERINRTDKKEFRRKLEELEGVEIGLEKVKEVKLFESKHTGNGTEYIELETVQLGSDMGENRD